ncbi:MAG: protease pro-enzyme activation domain-containing protein [Acidimicrobiales bacterium]
MPGPTEHSRGAAAAAAAVAFVAALVCAVIPLASATAQVRRAPSSGQERLIVAPVPAVPTRATRLGPLNAQASMTADVVLRPRDAKGLASLALAVSTPGSALRGDYLTPAQLRNEFGPTTAQVRSVESGLRRLGLKVGAVTPDHLTIHVDAPASVVERALHTSVESYRLASGRIAFANTSPATLPATIGAQVETVIGLSDVARYMPLNVRPNALRPVAKAGPAAKAASGRTGASATDHIKGAPSPCADASEVQSQAKADEFNAYTADELAGAYGMTGLYADHDFGKGVTVGIFELERDYSGDIDDYESCYGISTKVSYFKVDHGSSGSKYGGGEAALDIEDVAGLAPDAKIDVYQGPNNNVGPYDVFQYIIDHPVAQVVTTSWGECEQDLGGGRAAMLAAAQAESTLFEFAAAEGQSWMSAAGDTGSTDCTIAQGAPTGEVSVDDPGAQPYVTSVGGTTLKVRVSAKTESVWNESNIEEGAGGGGISALWPMPAYQSGATKSLGVINKYSSGKPCLATTGDCREVPDVTADADPSTGYIITWEGSWGSIGGTSAASPLWAAVTALTDASSGCGGKAVGFLNPLLYDAAGSTSYASDFTDITRGNNDYKPSGYTAGDFPALTGYDMASGLGSPLVTSAGGGLAAEICQSLKTTQPGVDSISPDSGPASGGNKVTIYGYGFTDVTSVEFGSTKAKFTIEQASEPAPTKLVATVPAGSGTQWVTVHNGKYTNSHTPGDRYTYT